MTAPVLTAKQLRFIDEFLVDANGTSAAIRAGYTPRSARVAASRMMTKDNPVRRAIQARQAADAARLSLDRQKVISGLLESIDLARKQENPMAMVAGWREVAKMQGYYAPEVRKVDVNIAAKRVIEQLETLPDAELLRMVEAQS